VHVAVRVGQHVTLYLTPQAIVVDPGDLVVFSGAHVRVPTACAVDDA